MFCNLIDYAETLLAFYTQRRDFFSFGARKNEQMLQKCIFL